MLKSILFSKGLNPSHTTASANLIRTPHDGIRQLDPPSTLINCYLTLFLPSPSSPCLSFTGRCNSSLASTPSDKYLRRLLLRLHRRLLLRFHLFAVYPATVSPTPSPTASPIRLHLRRLLFQSIGTAYLVV
ncbi:hypothetical protein L1887_30212 [Cichorium endivia]|nr:hypothetical protein L1887_30212 [Cichorium endivia]